MPDTSQIKEIKLLSWKDVFKACYLDDPEDKKRYVSVEELIDQITDFSSNARLASIQTVVPDAVKEFFNGQREAYLTVLELVGVPRK